MVRLCWHDIRAHRPSSAVARATSPVAKTSGTPVTRSMSSTMSRPSSSRWPAICLVNGLARMPVAITVVAAAILSPPAKVTAFGSTLRDRRRQSNLDACLLQCTLDHGTRVLAEIGPHNVGLLDQYDARFRGKPFPGMERNARSHLGGKLDPGHAAADDHERIVPRDVGTLEHLLQVTIEGHRGFVGVDIECVLGDTRNGQRAELASRRQDQSVVALGRGCTASVFDADKRAPPCRWFAQLPRQSRCRPGPSVGAKGVRSVSGSRS